MTLGRLASQVLTSTGNFVFVFFHFFACISFWAGPPLLFASLFAYLVLSVPHRCRSCSQSSASRITSSCIYGPYHYHLFESHIPKGVFIRALVFSSLRKLREWSLHKFHLITTPNSRLGVLQIPPSADGALGKRINNKVGEVGNQLSRLDALEIPTVFVVIYSVCSRSTIMLISRSIRITRIVSHQRVLHPIEK